METEQFVRELLDLLVNATEGCTIQHNGCPCRTCFYDLCDRLGLSDRRATDFWRVVLVLRGDYTEEELCKTEDYEEAQKLIIVD